MLRCWPPLRAEGCREKPSCLRRPALGRAPSAVARGPLRAAAIRDCAARRRRGALRCARTSPHLWPGLQEPDLLLGLLSLDFVKVGGAERRGRREEDGDCARPLLLLRAASGGGEGTRGARRGRRRARPVRNEVEEGPARLLVVPHAPRHRTSRGSRRTRHHTAPSADPSTHLGCGHGSTATCTSLAAALRNNAFTAHALRLLVARLSLRLACEVRPTRAPSSARVCIAQQQVRADHAVSDPVRGCYTCDLVCVDMEHA